MQGEVGCGGRCRVRRGAGEVQGEAGCGIWAVGGGAQQGLSGKGRCSKTQSKVGEAAMGSTGKNILDGRNSKRDGQESRV